MRFLVPLLLALAGASLAVAQETKPSPDPCGDCRNAASAEKAKCETGARDPAARELCAKRASEATLACQLNACKPGVDSQLAGNCPDCQHRAAEEERACRQMRIGSPEHSACTQRVGRMKAQCEEKYCKLAPPK